MKHPTVNEALERIGQSPRPGGDEVRLSVSSAGWEDDEFMELWAGHRAHLFLDLHLREKTKKELFAVHGAEALLGGEQGEDSESV